VAAHRVSKPGSDPGFEFFHVAKSGSDPGFELFFLAQDRRVANGDVTDRERFPR
jgi:hypothetical protein